MNVKSLANGMTALRQTVALLIFAGAGIVSITLVYSQVQATDEQTKTNTAEIRELKESLVDMASRQMLIGQTIENEKELNKEFRSRTDAALNTILGRLPSRESLRR